MLASARPSGRVLIAGALLSCVFLLLLSGCPRAGDGRVGKAACLACHDGRSGPDQSEFRQGPHAAVECETCHGPGLAHVRNAGRGGLFIENPAEQPYAAQIQVCVDCHGAEVTGHSAHAHGEQMVSCNACHDVHKRGGMIFSTENETPLTGPQQSQLCGECHWVQTEGFAMTAHAAPGGPTCATCHDVHSGSVLTVPQENNQVCQQCHAQPGMGLETTADVDAHTGAFHPVDPEGTGASRCTGCHNVPLFPVASREFAVHDHTFLTVPPLETNEAIEAGQEPIPPNSCAGVMGCHDPNVPGSGMPHDLENMGENRAWQGVYDSIGVIPE